VHSVDFDVCAWIAAAFYIGIVLRENAFRAHLYLIAASSLPGGGGLLLQKSSILPFKLTTKTDTVESSKSGGSL
jgi:NADH:ubiquinone oxidoreductase subunit 6 (subunit J)